MREIKFRAQDYTDKCWVCSSDNGLYNFFYGIEDGQLDSKTLGQYTELKDKNGKEIYEGDIIKNCWGIYKGAIGVVEWEDWGFEISIRKGDKRSFYDEMGSNFLDDEIEVIGNIWENKELLNDN